MRLTIWHKGTSKPVRDGVYQRDYGCVIYYCQFRLNKWCCGAKDISLAAKSNLPSMAKKLSWRGITKDRK